MQIMPVTISILIAIMSAIFSVTFYKYNELQAVKSNIESAIVKGIDPIAVRCAYANQKDVVCAVYASHVPSLPSPKK